MYYVFGCQHENAFIIFLYFSHTCITTFFLIKKKKKNQIDLVDVTLLSDSNCWPLFFRSVFFYFESCTASMTPIELPPKIKIRHVSIQGREWVGVGSVLYICIFGPASIRILQNYCNDNVTPFCSRFRNSLS